VDPECRARIARAITSLCAPYNPYVMADRMRLRQPQFSELARGRLTRFSFERLLLYITRLGHDVEITLRPAAPLTGLRRPRHGRIVIRDESDPHRMGQAS
jgi:hypothetical protein